MKKTTFFLVTSLCMSAAMFAGNKKSLLPKDEGNMDKFVTELMSKMTLQEKLGQLNLPVTGNITTGQAKSSDVAGKISRGEVGGLFNLKGVKAIREMQELAVEKSRLGIPLLFGMDVIHGYETVFPIPLGLSCTWDMEAIEKSARIAAVEASADGIAMHVGAVFQKVMEKIPIWALRLQKLWSEAIRERRWREMTKLWLV